MRLRDHFSCDLLNREFLGISQIARTRHVRRALHQQLQPTHQVLDETEAASLPPGAVNRDRSTSQGLHDEIGDDTSVVLQHSRTVGVEDAGDLDLNAMSAVVVEEESFGSPFALIITGARTDRIDAAGITLRLRVNFRISVNLAGRGLQYPARLLLGQFQYIESADHARLHGANGGPVIVARGRRTCQIVDPVYIPRNT